MARTLGAGFRVGHWTDETAMTGCTVVLPPPGNVASCDIRGSSPSTREIEHLHPDRRLTEVHAVLLTGGSAFGLAAATGVVEWLAERGVGYQTLAARVPIVPAAVVNDLGRGDPRVRPGAAAGRPACDAAVVVPVPTGRVGAGTGATVGKWAGLDRSSPGGVGLGHATEQGAAVAALAVVNSVGDVLAPDGTVLAGTQAPEPRFMQGTPPPASNTVLAVVAVHANLTKLDVRWLAERGSDGVTQTVRPAHTRYDGDVTFAVAAPSEGGPDVALDLLGYLATQAVADAVRDAVT